MLKFKGKEMTVVCDSCRKEASAPVSVGIIHFDAEGWSMFRRNKEGDLVQFCELCSLVADPNPVEAKAGVVINPDEIALV